MNRRSLLRMLGVGMGAAVVSPASAERVRILPPVTAGELTAGGDKVGSVVRRFLGGDRVGDRRTHGGLTVLWLHAAGGPTAFAIPNLDGAPTPRELAVAEPHQAAVAA